jgi:hypothetical protein
VEHVVDADVHQALVGAERVHHPSSLEFHLHRLRVDESQLDDLAVGAIKADEALAVKVGVNHHLREQVHHGGTG